MSTNNLLTNYEWATMIREELAGRMSFAGDYEGILQADIMKALNYYIQEMEIVQGNRNERTPNGGWLGVVAQENKASC